MGDLRKAFDQLPVSILSGTTMRITAAGAKVRCMSATGPFSLSFKGLGYIDFKAGYQINVPDGAEDVFLKNTAGFDITVLLVMTPSGLEDNTVTFDASSALAIAANSALSEVADVTIIADAAAVPLVGINANRAHLVVGSHPDNTANVRVGAAPSANTGFIVQPGTNVNIPITGPVSAWVTGSNAVVTISEVLA